MVQNPYEVPPADHHHLTTSEEYSCSFAEADQTTPGVYICPGNVEGVHSCGKGICKTNSAAAYGGVVVRIMAGRWTLQLNKDTKPWQGLHSTYSQNFGFVRDGGVDEQEVQKN